MALAVSSFLSAEGECVARLPRWHGHRSRRRSCKLCSYLRQVRRGGAGCALTDGEFVAVAQRSAAKS
eukprot:NODE_8217_length_1514_cov_3.072098.p8 GENE.NODE_8217_length_1514_cov_3.072098~~NODE_8217_length_1514_cov_3.072098.p8  ORF type:complete len:67 (+),score=10.01 NODE_8217_length_1514_cov_3.072098:1052-1252(+)